MTMKMLMLYVCGRGPRIPQEGPTCPHATARQKQKLNTVGVDAGIIVAA